MKLERMHRIAMLGIGGAGMKGLAQLLHAQGIQIMGVERNNPQETQISGTDIVVVDENVAAQDIGNMELIIHTDAIGPDHPLLRAAHAAGVPTQVYHEALGQLTHQKRTLAITGTHGKSSTTSMVAHIFVAAGLDPSALVGAPIPAWDNAHARIGGSDFFIVEADEYRNHFLTLKPESAIITTIDFDHPDFFASLVDVEKCFARFVERLSPDGFLVVPELLPRTFRHIQWPAQTMAVAAPKTPIDIILPGTHMQYNAWLAIHLGGHYGIEEAAARRALQSWPGLGRRFEKLGRFSGMEIISDYGHHPQEIVATLKGARERYPTQKIGVIFEAHTQERLRHFGDDFAAALALADGVIIAPVFIPGGRERIQAEIADLVTHFKQRLSTTGLLVFEATKLSELSQILTAVAGQFEVIVAFSAGAVDQTLRTFVTPE